jgi:hypothetical protein
MQRTLLAGVIGVRTTFWVITAFQADLTIIARINDLLADLDIVFQHIK